MPPETEPTVPEDRPPAEALPAPPRRRRPRRLSSTVRGMLVLVAVGWAAVFGVALWLDPYRTDDGSAARKMGTHRQLGLPPCGFQLMTGRPCPSCGMTTSFSLMMHADPLNAARANWVGVLLVCYGLVMVPWAIVSAARGRYLGVRSFEVVMIWTVSVFLVLILSRWAVVLLFPASAP